MRRPKRRVGQAIVEFALAATLIFFMLTAAVDLGLIFFAVQGLHNAAQEGATYGSRWMVYDAAGRPVLDINGIRERVRKEAGNRGGIGFVNLLDLNNNQTLDVTGGAEPVVGASGVSYEMLGGQRVIDDYIQVALEQDDTGDGAPDGTPCANMNDPLFPCYVRVTVRFDYRPVFPLAPAIGSGVPLRSTYFLRLRASTQQGGVLPPGATPPAFATVTPTPSPSPSPSPTGTPGPTQETLSVNFSGGYYIGAPNSNRKGYVKVRVTRPNGDPVTGAVVTTSNGWTLTHSGNGWYTACGQASPPNTISVSAVGPTGAGNSGNKSRTNNNTVPTCP